MAYPIFKEYDNLLTNNDIEELYKKVNFSVENMKNAKIYDRTKDTNLEDHSMRKCKEMRLDKSIHEWLDEIITPQINSPLKDIKFEIADTQSRIISYDEDDFFAKHTDVINVSSNLFKNYSLLVCLEECEEGGETSLYPTEDFTYTSNYTGHIRGGGLIFPKGIMHEGLPIKKGKKVILFINYYCYKLDKDYVIVHVEKGDQFFIIPGEILERNESMVSAFYHFNKNQNLDSPRKNRIYHMNESELTAEEFEIFYKDLFDQSDYDFENYRLIREKMEYLCYNLKNIDEFDMEHGYKVYPKECNEIIDHNLKDNSSIKKFRSKITSIQEYKIINYLYVDEQLVFFNHCDVDMFDCFDCGGGTAFGKNSEYLDECCDICKNGEIEYILGAVELLCLDCLEKIYKYYKTGVSSDIDVYNYKHFGYTEGDIMTEEEEKRTRPKDDDEEELYYGNKREFDKYGRKYLKTISVEFWTKIQRTEGKENEYKTIIDELFKIMNDEDKMGVTITGGNNEPGHTIEPDFYLDKTNKSKETIQKSNINYFNSLSDENITLDNFNVFSFIKKLLNDDKFTSIEEEIEPYWAGKSNYEAIYQMVERDGLIDINKFSF